MRTGIFVGLSTIDVVYSIDQFPAANSKVAARSQDLFVGGPATNAAFTFGHLGGEPTLVTTAGRHVLSSVVRKELQRHSIQLIDLNSDFDEVPVISSICIIGTGERNVISANAKRVKALPARVDERVLEDAAIVLVDGHYMQACQVWASAARARGIPVVLDGGSWKDGTQDLLDSVDTAICSADFLPPGCSPGDEVVNYLRDCSVTNIAITNGAEAVRFQAGVSSGMVQVPQVRVVDTLGAGDIFHGAFCYHASIGRGFVEALEAAATIAAESCRFRGTREWMNH